MRLFRAAAALLLLLLPEAPRAEAPFAERVPRAWCGAFRWDGDPREQHVTIRFARIAQRADGGIEAEGPALVRFDGEPPDRAIPFRMRAVINPATRRIEMFESIDAPRADFVTDGSHVGTLAADLRTMNTVWTTRGTGRRGAMHMTARPEQADLAQGCAPPSSRAPGPPLHNSLTHFAALTRAAKFAMN